MAKKFYFVFLIVLLLFVSCASNGTTSSLTGNTSSSVSVSGTGTVYMKADMVSFRVEVSETRETTALAQQATNKKVSSVLSVLRSFGIPEEDIATTSLSFYTDYLWENGRQIKKGETVSQSVAVKMKDLDRFPSLVDALGSSVSGITLSGVNFDVEDKSSATAAAREAAYADALAKAASYAKHSGMRLGNPISITEGYSSVGRTVNFDYKMMETVATAESLYSTETPTGLLSVSVNVSAVFELR